MSPSRRGHLLVLASYLVLSTLFTWPFARFDPGILPTRHFDLLPAVWLVEGAPGTFPGMLHLSSAWPFGESLARVDSYLLLVLAWLNHGLLPGWVLTSLVAWLGPVASAMAAEWCARRAFLVPRPWSWLSGTVFAFSGIAAVAALEGHVYQLLNPWLPLLLGAMWIGLGGRWRWGFLAGAAFVGALYTTAYFGVTAAILVGVVLLRSLLVERHLGNLLRWLSAFLLVSAPFAAWYLYLFSFGGRWADGGRQPDLFLRMGTATLGGLAAWSSALDLGYHSLAAPVGFTALSLALMAPILLRGRSGWRWLLALGLLALLFTLGRTIRADVGSQGYVSPMALVAHVPGLAFFRFPIRLAWIYTLCVGIVGARCLAVLGEGAPRWTWISVFVFAVVDVLFGAGLPLRQGRVIGEIPGAYAAAPRDRAVLDLFGVPFDRSGGEVEMWSRNLSCFYQASHRRPILEVCIGTAVDSPRERVDRWLVTALMAEPDADRRVLLRQRLAGLGIGAVALHADYYRIGDAVVLGGALESLLGPPLADTEDGGEHLALYGVTDAGPVSAEGARQAYGALLAEQ